MTKVFTREEAQAIAKVTVKAAVDGGNNDLTVLADLAARRLKELDPNHRWFVRCARSKTHPHIVGVGCASGTSR